MAVMDVLRTLNPDDIESIEVLKGDAAVMIWGERAANGLHHNFSSNLLENIQAIQ